MRQIILAVVMLAGVAMPSVGHSAGSLASYSMDGVISKIDPHTLLPPPIFDNPETQRQTICMALLVYHEARGEPLEGQIAVIDVLLNRAHATKTVPCDVLTAQNGRQFPWVRKPPATLIPRDLDAWRRVQTLARWRYDRAVGTSVIGEAMFFFNAQICRCRLPGRVVRVIGHHVFVQLGAKLGSGRKTDG